MNEEVVDDFLAHYGVSGMKWGKRHGSLKSRTTGAVKDSLQRRITTNKEIAAGRGQTRDFRRVALKRTGGIKTGAAVLTGSKKVAGVHAKVLSDRLKRVEKGKMNLGDKIDAVMNTHIADLVVSRTDKRGLPGATQNKVNKGHQAVGKILLGVGGAAILSLNTKQNRAVAGHVVKIVANTAVGAAMNAKKKSNATKAYNTNRSNTHGITAHPTIRLQQNPVTGNWI